MKHQSRFTLAAINKRLFNTVAMICVLILPVTGYSQTTPPPPGPGGGGGTVDAPLGGVPFDNNMTLAFLVAAVLFAVVIIKKLQKKKLALN